MTKNKRRPKNTSIFPFNLIIISCSFYTFIPQHTFASLECLEKCHVPDKCTLIIVQFYCIHRSSLMKLFIHECRLFLRIIFGVCTNIKRTIFMTDILFLYTCTKNVGKKRFLYIMLQHFPAI